MFISRHINRHTLYVEIEIRNLQTKTFMHNRMHLVYLIILCQTFYVDIACSTGKCH